MSIGLNNSIVSNGLVFYFDEKNRFRSYLGSPTTNLFLSPNNFTDANWTNSGLVITRLPDDSSSFVDPSGYASQGDQAIYTVAETATTVQHYLAQTFALTNGQTYTISVYAKAAERSTIWLSLQGQGVSIFNVANGTVTQQGAASSCNMTDLGNGWYRCSATIVSNATSSRLVYVGVNNAATYLGVANNGVYLSRAMFQVGTLTQYTGATARTNLTNCYDLITGSALTANNTTFSETGVTFTGANNCAIDTTFNTYGNNLTLEAWAMRTSVNSVVDIMVGRGLPYIGLNTINQVFFASYVNSNNAVVVDPTPISSNVYHHAVATQSYDVTSNLTTITLYIDGVPVNSQRFVGSFTNASGAFTTAIGAFYTGAGSTDNYNFAGKISNVKIYNRALTRDEVYQNYLAHKKAYQ